MHSESAARVDLSRRDGSGPTRGRRLSNTDPAQCAQLVESLAEDEGRWSMFLRQESDGDPALGSEHWRSHAGMTCLAPLVVPEQEMLVRIWLERRLDIELEEDAPLADAINNGILLKFLVSNSAWVPSVPASNLQDENEEEDDAQLTRRERRQSLREEIRSSVRIGGTQKILRAVGMWDEPRVPLPLDYHACARAVNMFLHHARELGLESSELFEIEDLLFYRNVPRVLRTIAAFARRTDYERFAAAADDVPGARLTWTEGDEPNERWDGDDLIYGLVKSFKRISTKRSLGILVVGPMGCGKSATVDTILGRRSMPQRHKLQFVGEDALFDADEVFERRKRRDFMSDPLLRFKLEAGVSPNTEACKCFVKIQGVAVTITELPSLESYVCGTADGQCLVTAHAGSFEAVRRSTANDRYEVVLLVDRLDSFRPNDNFAVCRNLVALFGRSIWDHAIHVFTHGSSLPADDLTYPEHVARCEQLCREIESKLARSSDGGIVPSVVIENSKACPTSEDSGEPVLPDGSAFMPKLLRTLENAVVKQNGLPPLTVRKRRPFWESWVVGGIVLWLVVSRL